MPPTIRIDGEVYSWLQGQARPFEDTPNSVLRRVAGLGAAVKSKDAQKKHAATEQKSRSLRNSNSTTLGRVRQMNGRQLNDEWKVGAQHALFHREGTWYNNLERFPGALFDPNGYVAFATEDDYQNCTYVQIGKETNVPKGISSIPGYVQKR